MTHALLILGLFYVLIAGHIALDTYYRDPKFGRSAKRALRFGILWFPGLMLVCGIVFARWIRGFTR